MAADKCAFVILTHNSASYIDACLDSVLALTSVDPYIFLADNGSEDDTCGHVQKKASEAPGRIRLFCNETNLGTTVPRNALIRKVPSDMRYICVLDSDTVVNDEAFAMLRDAMNKDKDISIAAPRMYNGDNVEQMSVKRFPRFATKLMKAVSVKSIEEKGRRAEQYPFFPAGDLIEGSTPPKSSDTNLYEADYAISACWFMRRETIARYGLLDEKIFYAPEDVDYCATVKEKGGKIILASGASIYHLTQRISKKKLLSRMNFLHLKGLVYYSRKHRKFLREASHRG